ncbi:hypothetical protein H5410_037474 [Solanum commersonii]|uniref:Reverse transcriptase zinc-binding domain-containing protein n=1 Tax=Solanum commersonii TaxID=4109 RepID=A0A9J5Y844_SOLCO|nr:hypothetical protein H5410_037474 [Solanum commersonii]
MKWLWRFNLEVEALWNRVVRIKVGMDAITFYQHDDWISHGPLKDCSLICSVVTCTEGTIAKFGANRSWTINCSGKGATKGNSQSNLAAELYPRKSNSILLSHGPGNASGSQKILTKWCFSHGLGFGAKESRLTVDNLQKSLYVCGGQAETLNHLFLHCPFTDQLCQLFLNFVGIKWSMLGTTTHDLL